jgi:hypothetical protein
LVGIGAGVGLTLLTVLAAHHFGDLITTRGTLLLATNTMRFTIRTALVGASTTRILARIGIVGEIQILTAGTAIKTETFIEIHQYIVA